MLVLLLLYALRVAAQTNKIFQWQFSNNFISTSLPSCMSLPIVVKPYDPNNDTHGVAPFYMIAFEVGGTPRTTLLGLNESSLTWTVDHPVGTNLMLSVVDTNGSAGGIPPRLYTVAQGQSTNCIQTVTNPDFTATANVSSPTNLTTCEPWGLRIKGGVPPYTVTLNALNSPIVTNVTLGGSDDAFTYIDRADPNTLLLAGISDFTGRWATGTPVVNTQGSSNVDCVGLVSSSGNSTQLQQQADSAAAAAASAKRKKSTAIGVGVTIGLLFFIAAVAFVVWYMRRRAVKFGRLTAFREPDTIVKPYEETSPTAVHEGQVLSINSWISEGPPTPKSAATSSFPIHTLPFAHTPNGSRPASSHSSASRPGFVAFPVRRSAKSMEASSLQPNSADSATFSPSSSARPLIGESGSESGAVREYVIQHQDGGAAVVRELPPPYMGASGSSS